MRARNPWLGAALALLVTLPLAAQASTPHWVHYKLLDGSSTPPKKVVIMPAEIKVFEMTAGGVTEEVPEWSKEASANVMKAVIDAVKKDSTVSQVPLPKLSAGDTANMDEHLALYKLVVNTARNIDLPHKLRKFDYGLGPGLAALQRSTGADAVVMIYGSDYASTAGRKTKAVLGHIPIVNIFTGPPPSLGHSFVHIGMIDLKTGDLLWMNSEYRDGASNLREAEDAGVIVTEIFKWYPAIEEYRQVYVR